MNDARMTIRLPLDELEFARTYARRHGLTLTGLVHRYFANLAYSEKGSIPQEVSEIAGIVPSNVDVREGFITAAARKHS